MTKGKLQINGTQVFKRNYLALKDDNVRFMVNQGGTRSSKTYSILQLLIFYALTYPNTRIAIYRKYRTTLNNSALPDLLDIIGQLGLYNKINYNKSIGSFSFPGGSVLRLYGADDPQILRGRKADLVFLNEANELNYEDFMQINMRTRHKIIVDFNPSDPFSWIHERLLTESNAKLIKSTYLDNPFLPAAQVREIENLINVDDNMYRIYVLGELPLGHEFIFPNISSGTFPPDLDFVYGMDFGFNDPTTILQVAIADGKLYIKEILHESYLNSEQLIEKMDKLFVSKQTQIYADSARPELIDTINQHGYSCYPAKKGPGSVIEGIDLLKTHEIIIDPCGQKTWTEFRNYKYKKLKDRITDQPQGFNDHSIDAVRYAATEIESGKFTTSFYV